MTINRFIVFYHVFINYEKFIIVSVNIIAPIYILRIFHAEYCARFSNFSGNVKYTTRVYIFITSNKEPVGVCIRILWIFKEFW